MRAVAAERCALAHTRPPRRGAVVASNPDRRSDRGPRRGLRGGARGRGHSSRQAEPDVRRDVAGRDRAAATRADEIRQFAVGYWSPTDEAVTGVAPVATMRSHAR